MAIIHVYADITHTDNKPVRMLFCMVSCEWGQNSTCYM